MSSHLNKILLAGILVLSLNYILSAQDNNGDRQNTVRLKMGYSKVVFREADPKDANAAFIVWAKVLQRDLLVKHNINTELTSVVYETINSIEDAIRKNEVDVLGLTAPEYFALKDKYNFLPGLTGLIDENIYSNYILVVRQDSGINNLSDLLQKDLLLPPVGKNPFIEIWLTYLLASQNKNKKELFFRKIEVVEKESNALYSLFFNKSDCAILLKRTFDVVSSLNPQIKMSLKILTMSPDLVIGLAAFRKDTESRRINAYLEVAKDAHSTPEGSNILKIFKSKKLVEITEKDLESTKQLIDSYNLILKKK